MTLKLVVDSLEEVPEAQRALYEADGEKFRLAVEGVPDVAGLQSTLAKLRGREKDLGDKLRTIEDRYKDVDLDEHARLLAEKGQLEQDASLKGKSREEQLAILLGPERKNHQRQVDGLAKQLEEAAVARDAATGALKQHRILGKLRAAGRAAKIREEFMDDLELRAPQFDIVDDKVVQLGPNGEPKQSEKDARLLAGPEEFIETLGKQKPLWFEASGGGGAAGGQHGPAGRGTISRHDRAAMSANVDEIASGKIKVV